MKKHISIMGAGGKMGCRILENLQHKSSYALDCVEIGEPGRKRLAALCFEPTPEAEAIARADIVVLALPDKLIGNTCKDLIPRLNPGTLIVSLDPAAAYAGVIPIRDDLSYFVCHPCHPPLFQFEESLEAHEDWFGGKAARQSVVCALYHGDEAAYSIGEQLASDMFGPILRMHRITVEQMAILEPAVVESVTSSFILACREALEEGIRMGVPEKAAQDFVLGHIRIQLAVIFGFADFPFSDGANLAIQQAQKKLLRDDWKTQISDLENVRDSVQAITDAHQD